MNIILTGATGGIGYALAHHLLSSGHYVGICYYQNHTVGNTLLEMFPKNAMLMCFDICDDEQTKKELQSLTVNVGELMS